MAFAEVAASDMVRDLESVGVHPSKARWLSAMWKSAGSGALAHPVAREPHEVATSSLRDWADTSISVGLRPPARPRR